jgi:hypothetical protein
MVLSSTNNTMKYTDMEFPSADETDKSIVLYIL